ncbi:unnamed protein product [Amoebophrya sp. A25]|nr:unnamed protein product [Amoebophrya sp. A25]|eukprot:GSA25T00006748001.1
MSLDNHGTIARARRSTTATSAGASAGTGTNKSGGLTLTSPLFPFAPFDSGVLELILSHLDVPSLSACCAVHAGPLSDVARCHPNWRLFILQNYGVYYDDYLRIIAPLLEDATLLKLRGKQDEEDIGALETCLGEGEHKKEEQKMHDGEVWRLLYVYIKQTVRNVAGGGYVLRRFRGRLKSRVGVALKAAEFEAARRECWDMMLRQIAQKPNAVTTGSTMDDRRAQDHILSLFFFLEDELRRMHRMFLGQVSSLPGPGGEGLLLERLNKIRLDRELEQVREHDTNMNIIRAPDEEEASFDATTAAIAVLSEEEQKLLEKNHHRDEDIIELQGENSNDTAKKSNSSSKKTTSKVEQDSKAELSSSPEEEQDSKEPSKETPKKEPLEEVEDYDDDARRHEFVYWDKELERKIEAYVRENPKERASIAREHMTEREIDNLIKELQRHWETRFHLDQWRAVINHGRGSWTYYGMLADKKLPLGAEMHRKYRGTVETSDDGKFVIWENGRFIQLVDIFTGAIVRTIDVGHTFRVYFHRAAAGESKLYVCLTDRVVGYDLEELLGRKKSTEETETATSSTMKESFLLLLQPLNLHCKRKEAEMPPWLQDCKGRPLELVLHRDRLALVESHRVTLWDCDSLDLVGKIEPYCSPLGEYVPPFPAFALNRRLEFGQEHRAAFEIQWLGRHALTWCRGTTLPIELYAIDVLPVAKLAVFYQSMLVPANWLQVDVCRVTWMKLGTLEYFLVGALDDAGIVSLWDTEGQMLLRFNGASDLLDRGVLDMIMTQDFVAVVDDDLGVHFYRLYLHPERSACRNCERLEGKRPPQDLPLTHGSRYFSQYYGPELDKLNKQIGVASGREHNHAGNDYMPNMIDENYDSTGMVVVEDVEEEGDSGIRGTEHYPKTGTSDVDRAEDMYDLDEQEGASFGGSGAGKKDVRQFSTKADQAATSAGSDEESTAAECEESEFSTNFSSGQEDVSCSSFSSSTAGKGKGECERNGKLPDDNSLVASTSSSSKRTKDHRGNSSSANICTNIQSRTPSSSSSSASPKNKHKKEDPTIGETFEDHDTQEEQEHVLDDSTSFSSSSTTSDDCPSSSKPEGGGLNAGSHLNGARFCPTCRQHFTPSVPRVHRIGIDHWDRGGPAIGTPNDCEDSCFFGGSSIMQKAFAKRTEGRLLKARTYSRRRCILRLSMIQATSSGASSIWALFLSTQTLLEKKAPNDQHALKEDATPVVWSKIHFLGTGPSPASREYPQKGISKKKPPNRPGMESKIVLKPAEFYRGFPNEFGIQQVDATSLSGAYVPSKDATELYRDLYYAPLETQEELSKLKIVHYDVIRHEHQDPDIRNLVWQVGSEHDESTLPRRLRDYNRMEIRGERTPEEEERERGIRFPGGGGGNNNAGGGANNGNRVVIPVFRPADGGNDPEHARREREAWQAATENFLNRLRQAAARDRANAPAPPPTATITTRETTTATTGDTRSVVNSTNNTGPGEDFSGSGGTTSTSSSSSSSSNSGAAGGSSSSSSSSGATGATISSTASSGTTTNPVTGMIPTETLRQLGLAPPAPPSQPTVVSKENLQAMLQSIVQRTNGNDSSSTGNSSTTISFASAANDANIATSSAVTSAGSDSSSSSTNNSGNAERSNENEGRTTVSTNDGTTNSNSPNAPASGSADYSSSIPSNFPPGRTTALNSEDNHENEGGRGALSSLVEPPGANPSSTSSSTVEQQEQQPRPPPTGAQGEQPRPRPSAPSAAAAASADPLDLSRIPNARLDCPICRTEFPDFKIVALPCGHTLGCSACAGTGLAASDRCPVCHQPYCGFGTVKRGTQVMFGGAPPLREQTSTTPALQQADGAAAGPATSGTTQESSTTTLQEPAEENTQSAAVHYDVPAPADAPGAGTRPAVEGKEVEDPAQQEESEDACASNENLEEKDLDYTSPDDDDSVNPDITGEREVNIPAAERRPLEDFCWPHINSDFVRKVNWVQIPHIDSYFAAYRNYLNVCTFHKSGKESLQVFDSGSLATRLRLPAAKHTKFEEWTALQVEEESDSLLFYDFRPAGFTFDQWIRHRAVGARRRGSSGGGEDTQWFSVSKETSSSASSPSSSSASSSKRRRVTLF